MKFKGFSGMKKYDGEYYFFKKGVAKVPGMRYRGKPMLISFAEFNKLTREE